MLGPAEWGPGSPAAAVPTSGQGRHPAARPGHPVSASSTSLRWCFRGHPATWTSAIVPYFAVQPSTWRRAPTPAGCDRHQPCEKQEGDDHDDQAAAEPEQKAERAVERADPAVEHHVGNAPVSYTHL